MNSSPPGALRINSESGKTWLISDAVDLDRPAQLRALLRVARYRPVFTAAIIGLGLIAAGIEAVGLSFIMPIVEIVQSPGDPAAEADGVLAVFVAAYRTLGIPFTLGSVVVGVSLVLTVRWTSTFFVPRYGRRRPTFW